MPDFINTIDVLGDDVVMDSIIDRTITEFKDDTLTEIGKSAFTNCTNLTTVNLPNVVKAAQDCFCDCVSLKEINLPELTTLPGNFMRSCLTIQELYFPKVTKIVGSYCFQGCTSLESIDFPLLISANPAAFAMCDALTRTNLPSLETAGQMMFHDCKHLTNICLPKLATITGPGSSTASMFRGCFALKIIDVPSVTSIDTHGLGDCSALTALLLRNPNGICTLAATTAFNTQAVNGGKMFIYVPGNLVNSYKSATNWSTYANQFRGILGDEEALQGIIDETLVDFENNEIESIPAYSFYKYEPLKSVKSDSVTEIGESTFENCTGLDSIKLSNVINIGKNAFKGCSAITELTSAQFPSVDKIVAEAFDGCSGIQVIDLPSLTDCANFGSLKGTALTSVNLPNLHKVNVGYYMTFAMCSNLVSVNFPKLEKFSFYSGNEFANCTNLTNVNVPSLVRLGNAGFSKCTSLTKLDLPKVTSIGNNAFEHTSSLIALILRSDSVCTVGVDAFKGPSAIGNGTGFIYVPGDLVAKYVNADNWKTYKDQFRGLIEDENIVNGIIDETLVNLQDDKLTEIPYGAFRNYAALEAADLPNVTKIGMYGFYATGIAQAKLSNLTQAGEYAFSSCDNLISLEVPNLEVIPSRFISHCPSIEYFCAPSAITVNSYSMAECSSLKTVDLPSANSLGSNTFYASHQLQTLILRNANEVCAGTLALSQNTPIAQGTGYIYVPRALIEDYKVAENWSTYASQFRALEDYTVDGTTTGELDESKI